MALHVCGVDQIDIFTNFSYASCRINERRKCTTTDGALIEALLLLAQRLLRL